MKTLSLTALIVLLSGSQLAEAAPSASIPVPTEVQATLANHCNGCHGEDASEGGVRFDNLNQLNVETQLSLLNRAQDQLFFGLMPPEDSDQLALGDHKRLADWMRGELQGHGVSQLDARLPYLGNGNLVDHEQLFSGEVTDKAYTPARRWRVRPQIFHERVIDLFELSGRERDFYSKQGRAFYGVTNPFILPERSGVRDFDLSTLDAGHLLVMLDNAKWVSEKQTHRARVLNKEMEANEFPNEKDRWLPPSTPGEFEAIILNDSTPSDTDLIDAIQKQFGLVLQRPATQHEVNSYLVLTKEAIQLSGNTVGLQQMLTAVLLESEFLYRLEFGEGPADEYGRMKLSPREAAYAISYAIGDRNPDRKLIEAAQQGRLTTHEDYRREVTRLLNDDNFYRGQIDPSLNGKHYQSNETSHPRIVRFFRDFFGYPGALKVFKDSGRSEGKYMNPDRGSQGTPGRLILEADRIVTRHVEKDENVFENLLTFDEFFVYHDKDNETGRKVLREWREVYEALKDTEWKTDPQRVLDENLDFLKSHEAMRIKDASRPGELVNYMHYFEESFGQGRNPFTTVPWAHGYYFHHAPFYNLPPTPVIGRYGSWRSLKYISDLAPKEFWDYPPEQPFKIQHRKGILTHPAWLIAHSSNFHTDPIKRGRWVREKLLAGRVPDVPITVDAQVPEDPHKTFRQRVEMVTQQSECWKCHKQMNPLGFAFEVFDDFGRFRTHEPLENAENLIRSGNGKSTFDVYKTAPIVSQGELIGTGDPKLDGEVADAFELIDLLAESAKVRQSIIRHAFRFYLGRNEMLSDSQTLIDADRAYVSSGGSFKAVIISLLTSDSFMYRKPS
ncbi:hypothetical protein Pan97_28640 [Bremerella volcania]|uniref:Planctomycete cytochrome C n=1 Tax=Bremerella volcania TaxID=2527984 RepID=A0A518C9C7_9BACT|nr:DUF1588 domain-containing protein [Bremerella volcania]QDU75822.1 hypothetical protein Pan97_28640 [Bremerella volcania]